MTLLAVSGCGREREEIAAPLVVGAVLCSRAPSRNAGRKSSPDSSSRFRSSPSSPRSKSRVRHRRLPALAARRLESLALDDQVVAVVTGWSASTARSVAAESAPRRSSARAALAGRVPAFRSARFAALPVASARVPGNRGGAFRARGSARRSRGAVPRRAIRILATSRSIVSRRLRTPRRPRRVEPSSGRSLAGARSEDARPESSRALFGRTSRAARYGIGEGSPRSVRAALRGGVGASDERSSVVPGRSRLRRFIRKRGRLVDPGPRVSRRV